MNKDAVLASVIGFGIGLLITGGILLGPTLINQLAMQQRSSGEVASATQASPTLAPTPSTSSDVLLTIDTPVSESISQEEKVTISGKSPTGRYVVIAGDIDEAVAAVTNDTYTGTITLKEGKNDVSVTSVGETNSTSQRITIYYTP